MKDKYVFIKKKSMFYRINESIFLKEQSLQINERLTKKEINEKRVNGEIEEFKDICYLSGGKEGLYNLLDEDTILKPSNFPELHPDIKCLIDNLCGGKQENIDYLHKSLLYKYLNINDYTIPAIVFYGSGGSGKGTFITLLSTIFGSTNVLANLGQKELSSEFDTYKGGKIIVSYDEITSNNTASDKRITNKLKNMIFAENITVNTKNVPQYQIGNIAWFFISSNSNKPIQLDDKDKGNRRFSIIKSMSKLNDGEKINITVRDIEAVSNYLAWLLNKYPEVKDYKKITALDNKDKRDLEESSQQEANAFWERLIEEKNALIVDNKITLDSLKDLMDEYCLIQDLNFYEFKKFFWQNSRFIKKKFRIGDKTFRGVEFENSDLIIRKDLNENEEELTIEDAIDIFS